MNVQIKKKIGFFIGWKGRQNFHVYRQEFCNAVSCKAASVESDSDKAKVFCRQCIVSIKEHIFII